VTEAELKSAYEAQKPLLAAWGSTVKEEVLSRLEKAPGLTKPLAEFLKIPVEPRVKATDSFLAKALRRGKDYERPLDQITDKVGVRFVVLLLSELKLIEDVIEGCEQKRRVILRPSALSAPTILTTNRFIILRIPRNLWSVAA